LKRPGNEPPAGVERAIELIEGAHRERQRVLELDHRIGGMRENIRRFTAQVADVVAAAAPDLGRLSPEPAAQELRRRLDAQREVLARRDQLLRQQKTAREKLGEAEAGKCRAEAERESVRTEVGGETDERSCRASPRPPIASKPRRAFNIASGNWPRSATAARS
jgi:uncharacterized protein YhaN